MLIYQVCWLVHVTSILFSVYSIPTNDLEMQGDMPLTGEDSQFQVDIGSGDLTAVADDDINELSVININQMKCGDSVPHDAISAFLPPLFEMVYGYNKGRRNAVGHITYTGPMKNGIERLIKLQVCSYTLLDKFWALAAEYNISRWSAHGGTLMGAMCHRSINPWDDDIDITLSSCEALEQIFAKGTNVTEKYPNMVKNQHTVGLWEGRLIDGEGDDYVLIRGPKKVEKYNWFKLKAVNQILKQPTRDLGGMDIMCFDGRISTPEQRPMKSSGFRDAVVKEKAELQVVNYGPTKIMIVPDSVGRQYVLDRYKKEEYCDFPFDKTTPRLPAATYHETGRAPPPILPRHASQMNAILSNWYISQKVRDDWLMEIGKTPGNELNEKVPYLDEVEIDNSIAIPDSCRIAGSVSQSRYANNKILKVVGFNAGRATYWAEFAEMVETMPELEKPDVIILNEMDIGMARSGNVHTTRKLAFRLGMNYAWGLEFVELSNGNWQEQNQTEGMKNALGLHGNAILSRCPMYDPVIYRDKLDERYFSHKRFSGNAQGSEKRLGGRMGLFVRTGEMVETDTDSTKDHASTPHVIVGSVHKLEEKTYRKEIWDYLGFGKFPNITDKETLTEKGISAIGDTSTLGIIISGDLASRGFCTQSGLSNLDKPQKHRTFPADCKTQRLGHWRGDQFCGNMKVSGDDRSILPCYESTAASPSFNETVQISDHSIIQISLEMKG